MFITHTDSLQKLIDAVPDGTIIKIHKNNSTGKRNKAMEKNKKHTFRVRKYRQGSFSISRTKTGMPTNNLTT